MIQNDPRTLTQVIPFGEWLPDQAAFGNPGALEAHNVVPAAQGYRPLNSLATFAAATTASTPTGAASGVDNTGGLYMVCGDASTLYKLDTTTYQWQNVSRAGAYTSNNERWRFTTFGTYLIATNYIDPMQFYDMGTATNFADLTTVCRAKYVATVRDFVFAGHIGDIDGSVPYRVRWSALADPTDWTPSAATMSDLQDIPDAGAITGVVSGEYGTVLLERGINRFTFTGDNAIFQNDAIERGRGCMVPGSVATIGRTTFFLSEDGFYAFNGSQAIGIGVNKIDRWFFNDAKPEHFDKMTATVDPYQQIVLWSYVGSGAVGNTPNRLLVYHYADGKWSYGDAALECLARLLTVSASLDGLNTVYPSLEDIPASLDSRIFVGGKSMLSALSPGGAVQTFTGPAKDATIDTGEIVLAAQPYPRRSLIRSAMPLVDGGSLSVAVGARSRPNELSTWSAPSNQGPTGSCPLRNENLYHRFRVSISGEWQHAQGVVVEGEVRGKR